MRHSFCQRLKWNDFGNEEVAVAAQNKNFSEIKWNVIWKNLIVRLRLWPSERQHSASKQLRNKWSSSLQRRRHCNVVCFAMNEWIIKDFDDNSVYSNRALALHFAISYFPDSARKSVFHNTTRLNTTESVQKKIWEEALIECINLREKIDDFLYNNSNKVSSHRCLFRVCLSWCHFLMHNLIVPFSQYVWSLGAVLRMDSKFQKRKFFLKQKMKNRLLFTKINNFI